MILVREGLAPRQVLGYGNERTQIVASVAWLS